MTEFDDLINRQLVHMQIIHRLCGCVLQPWNSEPTTTSNNFRTMKFNSENREDVECDYGNSIHMYIRCANKYIFLVKLKEKKEIPNLNVISSREFRLMWSERREISLQKKFIWKNDGKNSKWIWNWEKNAQTLLMT